MSLISLNRWKKILTLSRWVTLVFFKLEINTALLSTFNSYQDISFVCIRTGPMSLTIYIVFNQPKYIYIYLVIWCRPKWVHQYLKKLHFMTVLFCRSSHTRKTIWENYCFVLDKCWWDHNCKHTCLTFGLAVFLLFFFVNLLTFVCL